MDQGANMVHNRYMTANCTGIIHVVKEGDTLYKIGKMHGVSVYNMSWNGGKEPRTGANAGQPQNMQSGETMQQPQSRVMAEEAVEEQESPEIMRMQGSRLEYEIMDDSEL